MSGGVPLLSRENILKDHGSDANESVDIGTEFKRLEQNITSGNEKSSEAYFKFMAFVNRHQRQLKDLGLCTASTMKPHFIRILQDFKRNAEAYRNDPRVVQYFIWTGHLNPNLFDNMYQRGIGDQFSVTYVMYARHLFKSGKHSEALAVLKKGLDINAFPVEFIEDAMKEMQSSAALQPKNNLSVVSTSQSTPELSYFDPHKRFAGDSKDFAPDQVRTYNFKSVYPDFHVEEFQFEERRLQRWIEKRKLLEEKRAIEAKNDMIMKLQENLANLQQELQCLRQKAVATPENPVHTAAAEPVAMDCIEKEFDDNTDSVPPITSTQKAPQLTEELPNFSEVKEQSDVTTNVQNNRTEMMTRDMRDMLWNGTLNSTDMVPSFEASRNEENLVIHGPPKNKMEVFQEDCGSSKPSMEVFQENLKSPMPVPQESPQPSKTNMAVFQENPESVKPRMAVFQENLEVSNSKMHVRETQEPSNPRDQERREPLDTKMAVFVEKIGAPVTRTESCQDNKRKSTSPCQLPVPAKRFAVCTDENLPGPSNRFGSPMPKSKVSEENYPQPPSDKDDEDKENHAPKGYSQPPPGSRRTSGVLVDAEGFETEPIPTRGSDVESEVDDDLGVSPLEHDDQSSGRTASTPTKNDAPEINWRVTEVLSGKLPLFQDVVDEGQSKGRLSTILEASKESASSGSSNSLGTPSVVNRTATIDDTLPTLNPIVSDPFNPALRNKVILGSKIPYETISGNLPVLKKKSRIQYPNGYSATIVKLVGEGGFAKVYFAERDLDEEDYPDEDQMMTTCLVRHDQAAIKVTKEITDGLWEYYILNTISGRLARKSTLPCIRKSIPEPHCAAYYSNGFLISLPYLPYGSLVDLVNKFNKEVPELLARYLILELMVIVMRLHDCHVVHGDLKPDNVLFRKLPTIQMIGELRSKTQCLCLIDFGQSIDLQKFSPGTTFSHVVSHDSQKCVAMRENRSWLYDFDWFGVANCAHTLLFGQYIEVEQTPSGSFAIKKRLPRYWNRDWWNLFFNELLNLNDSTSRPDNPDNPIKNIIELGGASLNNKDDMKILSLKLMQLKEVLQK